MPPFRSSYQCLGKPGIVKKVSEGKVRVCFGEDTWWCNAALLVPLAGTEQDDAFLQTTLESLVQGNYAH